MTTEMVWSDNILHAGLRLRYAAGKYSDGQEYPGVDEMRPLKLLTADLPQLQPYSGNGNFVAPPERNRPRQETFAALLLSAVSVPTYWREEWVAFWRDHFSIFVEDGNVGSYLPHWERTVIREHAFGNFRDFLEACSKHPCMQYYLNNRSSRAGSANENFARELFELHTLGRDAYLNNLYASWRNVPGALTGKPVGYIDQDVYEAARAFTGWSIEDGAGIGAGQSLPKTGRFTYVEGWHDNYQKRILATEFDPYSAPLMDGHRVLDLCANHPATAQHIATKLVRRMVSDNPPKAMIQSTARVFQKYAKAADQLNQVFRHLATEAQKIPLAQKQKVRRPLRLVSAFAQAVNLPLVLEDGTILSQIENAGPPIYKWPSPDGPPDGLAWYLSAQYVRQRINLVQGLAENWWGTGEFDPFAGLPAKRTFSEMLARWETPLFGLPRPDLSFALLASQNTKGDDLVMDARRARRLVGLLACAPSFQTEVVLPPAALQDKLI